MLEKFGWYEFFVVPLQPSLRGMDWVLILEWEWKNWECLGAQKMLKFCSILFSQATLRKNGKHGLLDPQRLNDG
jgi:hypothetical protein